MKKYQVTLEKEEREQLLKLIGQGKAAARKLMHARILLQTDEAEGQTASKDQDVARGLNIDVRTVERVRQRFVEQGLDLALVPAVRQRVYPRKLDGQREAHLIALACSKPPEGKNHWTLRLLADRMVELQEVDSLSHETVRQTLKKTSLSLI